MISNLTPIRIKSGVADSVNVNFLTGNSSYSTGTLDFYYHDLKVQTQNEHTGFMSLLENELYQTLLNLVIPADNNGYNRRHRTGYIWFRRDPEKGFMNFFWKSVFSGLKSSEGINSREQRALRKKK